MKLTLTIFSVFLLIITIGAPPVVENVKKETKNVDSKDDASDEVVRSITLFLSFLLFFFL